MKELAVKNYKTAEGQKISQGGNEFTVKPIVEQTDVDQCRVNFVEVEPGNFCLWMALSRNGRRGVLYHQWYRNCSHSKWGCDGKGR